MTPSILAAPAPTAVPSNKTWLLLLSLLSLLLVVGHWSQPLAGRPASAAHATARRVALQNSARLAGAPAAFAPAATL